MQDNLKSVTRALIVLISALFLLAQTTSASDAELAEALYREGDWHGARTEALRARLTQPVDPVATMIYALASLRLDPTHDEAAALAQGLVDELTDRDLRAQTAYEFGRIQWEFGHEPEAYALIRRAFQQARDYELFLKSAYSLAVLLVRHPELAVDGDPLPAQVRTVRSLIPPAVRQQATLPRRVRSSRSFNPALGLVRFYQTQIGPAIGQRCSMHPSCSTYCMQATREYGLLGVPLTADRLIRETDHINYRINPILLNGQEKYHDPVSDHTFWFRRKRR